MGTLPGGGVFIVEISRIPARENLSVLGMGVALILNISAPEQ